MVRLRAMVVGWPCSWLTNLVGLDPSLAYDLLAKRPSL